ncbi:thioredoxin reductase (NADPH) [Geodermatophilus amargosae]|uniref:Thioredoxin reductase (NADPH) n=1 Tax=Geodermatophilus amargosae TaxID=1296565 RepID=A0A1I7D6U7_9ACTN|nr:FAD-dependent oxidoreductase [Geodermatophilus amargosae]SFU07370.1 thioredoxin reductase (NADPH) [Geodermatophilus amargosae]
MTEPGAMTGGGSQFPETQDAEPSAAVATLPRNQGQQVDPRIPVILVVDADPQSGEATAAALRRRFAPDYRVLTAGSAEAALANLERLASAGDEVALVAADLRLPDGEGVRFLERAAGLHSDIARVLLFEMDQYHTRIPFTELQALQRATALGQIDFWMVKGWVNPEEWLYPQVQEALSAWSRRHRPSHVVYRIIGDEWDPRCHDLRDGLTVNGVPFVFHPRDSDRGKQLILEHRVDASRLPAAIRHDGRVLQDPSMVEIAVSHGIRIRPSLSDYDLVVLGAGPAGLAAGVYGASEGLGTLLLEARAIGGQAGTSSMIRNYLAFPRGISGGELAHRAWEQATLLGAEFVFTHQVTALTTAGGGHALVLTDGSQVRTRAVILATGVTYRHLGIPDLDRLVGAGVFYGAAGVAASAMARKHVYVVGGANSAGQAALHLAKYAARVTVLVRGNSLTAGMSDYLVRQIEATPNIAVRLRTQVIGGRGGARLEGLTLWDRYEQRQEDVPAAAVFVLIGAEPCTDWLRPVLSLDEHGFVLTGRDVPQTDWPLDREPHPFETSRPGVFAAGDVRYGSVKRVAGAVGEGSVAVGSVHRYLAELAAAAGQPSEKAVKQATPL